MRVRDKSEFVKKIDVAENWPPDQLVLIDLIAGGEYCGKYFHSRYLKKDWRHCSYCIVARDLTNGAVSVAQPTELQATDVSYSLKFGLARIVVEPQLLQF